MITPSPAISGSPSLPLASPGLAGLAGGEAGEGGFAAALAAALSPEIRSPGGEDRPPATALAAAPSPEMGSVAGEDIPPDATLLREDAALAIITGEAEDAPAPLALLTADAVILAADDAAAEALTEITVAELLPDADAALANPALAPLPVLPAADGGAPSAAGGPEDAAMRGVPMEISSAPPLTLPGPASPIPAMPAPAGANLAAGDAATVDAPPALAAATASAATTTADAETKAPQLATADLAATAADAEAPRVPSPATSPQGAAWAEPRAAAEAKPEQRLPPHATAVAVQASGARPARPASPSLTGAVSPSSLATLNAAASGQGMSLTAAGSQPANTGAVVGAAGDVLHGTAESTVAMPGIASPGPGAASAMAVTSAPAVAVADAAPPPPGREPGQSIALGAADAASDDATHMARGAELASATQAQDTEIKDARVQATQSQSTQAQPGQGSGTGQGQALPGQSLAGQSLAGLTTAGTSPTAGPQVPQAVPPPRAAPTTPAQQIMPVLVTLAGAGGAAAVTVTLEPLELGRVEISVRRGDDQKAKVQVVAERPETLLLLLRDQSALDRALTQAGVEVEGRSISFDLAPRDHQGQQHAHGGGEGGRSEGRGRAARRDTATDRDAIAPEPQRRRLSLGALDIAV